VLASKGASSTPRAAPLLEEDLRSPCTEEIAVFQAFSRIIREAGRKFVVMDTAPTGHTLLLLDATGAYHRDIVRQMGNTGVHFTTPMMQLQDPKQTKVLIVTLAETTPVLEAANLQADLRRAGIEPWAWVINNSVNLVVAVFIWVMIYPMMIQIDLGAVRDVGRRPAGPDAHAGGQLADQALHDGGAGRLFFLHVFAPWVPAPSASEYIAGMILLGVAPCTAMVFVWSQLVKGDANYTLVQVSVNDLIMVVAFAPIAALPARRDRHHRAVETLLLSTVLYVVLPLLAGMATRRALQRRQRPRALAASWRGSSPGPSSG
jgi:hypothetical protein